ncbi:dihydrofolate reductase [Syntrophomonas wolfei]|jgi:dihydrofolate reductase|uniref:dihydrofolate reductase n=2 Tax=Syntrophomonas wolfei TaxID=863 RepID=UPI000774DEBD|nr:dihydrofolate reductase [Syntrophomonas wolfei]
MKAIVAVDLNWGIGYKGNLLQRIPEDMKFFQQMTLGKVLIMGRETFESLPGKEPLKDRINIVLSKNEEFNNEKVIICRTLTELFMELKKYDLDNVFVIGGESIYTQLLPYCTEAYVTRIENTYEADKYFINFDKIDDWELVSSSDLKNYNNIQFRFLKFVNRRFICYFG